jgi:prophage tail gpP-like protein
MSTRPETLELIIGGVAHKGWLTYDIESDLMTPADAWNVRLAQPSIELPEQVVEGAKVAVRMTGETVLQGVLDERELGVSDGQHELQLSGRDSAGILLDCSAPIFTRSSVTLAQVVANIVKPLGIVRIRDEAQLGALLEKVNTEPGDSAWDTLRRAAEANGLWPWFEPDGTLVVGGPRYDLPPVDALVIRRDGKGNNVLSLRERRSIVERFSEISVYGQSYAVGAGAGERDARHNIKSTVADSGVTGYRPKVVVDHEATNEAIATARGFQLISEARLKGYTLLAELRGHRTSGGVLWSAGQRVAVKSEPHGIDGIYFIMGRRFSGGRTGPRTTLTLKEDGVWVPQVHPSKRRHRRGKNSLPGQIVDLSTGANQ